MERDELAKLLTELGAQTTLFQLDIMLKEADTNKDGLIQEDEFLEMMDKNPKMISEAKKTQRQHHMSRSLQIAEQRKLTLELKEAKTEALQNMENAHIDKRSALMTLKQTKEELNLLMTESAGYEIEKAQLDSQAKGIMLQINAISLQRKTPIQASSLTMFFETTYRAPKGSTRPVYFAQV